VSGPAFKFVHAADLHLDSPFKGLAKAPAAVRERARESTFAALLALRDLVEREQADFLVLAGDLFDAADRSLRAQLKLQRTLADIAGSGVRVFVAHGNHDPESGRRAKLDWPPGVFVFGSSEPECYPALTRAGELAAHVYGMSYATRAVADNLAARFRKREGAPYHVAVLHANVDGDPGHDDYAPCRLEELSAAGFDYWALGHVHGRRVLREYPHVVYPGNTQGRSVRETGPKGAYVVSVSGSGETRLAFRELGDVLWREIPVSIEGMEREQELQEAMLAALEAARREAAGKPTLARIALEGRGRLHEALLRGGVAEEWLDGLRELLAPPDEAEDWIWPESLSVRTGAITLPGPEDGGFLGDLLGRGLAALESPDVARELADRATEALRKQPRLREWLDGRSPEERERWIRGAMDRAAALLRDDDAG